MNIFGHNAIVNDANVLIDFCELALLPRFFAVPCEFFVPFTVWEELAENSKQILAPFVAASRLRIDDTVPLAQARTLQLGHQGLSLADCAAVLLAQNRGAILLTGDKAMRNCAQTLRVECHGHLWVFRQMAAVFPREKATLREKFLAICDEINPKLGIPPGDRAALLKELA